MPVEFLIPEQRQGYGRYAGEPTATELDRFFHLDDANHELVAARRGDHHRLGFAVQLCTARFLGTFLDEVREAPAGVVDHLARQLGLLGATVDLGLYGTSNHRWEHRAEIRRRGGYREFSTGPTARFALSRWLYALCWTGTERPGVLLERAIAWMLARKVLLPGVTVLERLIVGVRQRVDARLWRRLGGGLDPDAHARLEGLPDVPEGSNRSLLDRLRSGPTRRSAPELVRALERLEAVRALGIHVSTAAGPGCRCCPGSSVGAPARRRLLRGAGRGLQPRAPLPAGASAFGPLRLHPRRGTRAGSPRLPRRRGGTRPGQGRRAAVGPADPLLATARDG